MRWLPIFTIALMLPLAACATTRPATYLVETKGPYQLDTGDAVRVTVYGDAELSDTYQIDDSGAVAFPLVGPVQVRGQTTTGRRLRDRRGAGQWLYAQSRCCRRNRRIPAVLHPGRGRHSPASSPMSMA